MVTILPYPSHNPPSQLACPPGNYSFKPGGDALKEPLAQLLVTVDLHPHPSDDGLQLGLDFIISLTMDQMFFKGQISAISSACF